MDAVSRTQISFSTSKRDQVMRTIAAIAVIAASIALGGCFHHSQAVYTAELPPPPPTSIK